MCDYILGSNNLFEFPALKNSWLAPADIFSISRNVHNIENDFLGHEMELLPSF